MEKAGLNIQVSHKSLAAQGIERKPQIHEGPTAREIESKGRTSERSEINREIMDKASQIEKAERAIKSLTSAIERVQAQQEKPEVEQKKEQEQEPEKKTFSASEFLKNKAAAQASIQAERQEEVSKAKSGTTLEDLKEIARTKPLADIRALVQNLSQQTKQKDLIEEVKNSKEYIEKRREISDLQQREKSSKDTADRFKQMKEETKGLFKGKERAGYEKTENEYRQKQIEIAQQMKEAEATLKAIEHNLSRPESELAKSVKTHNENANKAAVALDAIKPIYNERQEKEKQQEQERTKQQTRGDFER